MIAEKAQLAVFRNLLERVSEWVGRCHPLLDPPVWLELKDLYFEITETLESDSGLALLQKLQEYEISEQAALDMLDVYQEQIDELVSILGKIRDESSETLSKYVS